MVRSPLSWTGSVMSSLGAAVAAPVLGAVEGALLAVLVAQARPRWPRRHEAGESKMSIHRYPDLLSDPIGTSDRPCVRSRSGSPVDDRLVAPGVPACGRREGRPCRGTVRWRVAPDSGARRVDLSAVPRPPPPTEVARGRWSHARSVASPVDGARAWLDPVVRRRSEAGGPPLRPCDGSADGPS